MKIRIFVFILFCLLESGFDAWGQQGTQFPEAQVPPPHQGDFLPSSGSGYPAPQSSAATTPSMEPNPFYSPPPPAPGGSGTSVIGGGVADSTGLRTDENSPSFPTNTPFSANPDDSAELRSIASADHPLKDVMTVERPDDSVVQGTPLYLHELLAGRTSPETRRILLREYWKLTEKYLVYKNRLLQLYLLYKISASYEQDMEIKPQIELAITQVEKLQKATELEFIQGQYLFAELAKRYNRDNCSTRRDSSGLFIPADFPLATAYNTESEKLAQSSKSRLLDKTIPLQYQVILNRHDACRAADLYLQSLIQNRRSPIQALSECIQERIELLRAVVGYNDQIADYVAETVGPEVSGRLFLSAVLKLPPSGNNSPQPQLAAPRGVSETRPVVSPQDDVVASSGHSIVQVGAVTASHVVSEQQQTFVTPAHFVEETARFGEETLPSSPMP